MNRRTSVKNKQDLVIKLVPNIIIKDCFVTTDDTLSISDYNFVSEVEKKYIRGFRDGLLRFRGQKALFIPWWDVLNQPHEAELFFNDNIDPRGITLLDMVIYMSLEKELDLHIEIETPLSINEEPIVRMMGGYFQDGSWYSCSKEELKDYVIDSDGVDNPKPLPITWRFQEFMPNITLL